MRKVIFYAAKAKHAGPNALDATIGILMNDNCSPHIFKCVQNATKDIVEAYQKQFSSLSKEIESAGFSAHRELMEASKQRTNELAQGIASELASVRQSAQEEINKELITSQEKIKSYEQQKIKELDDKVYQILGAIAKKTIGHAIDFSTHEELVLEALKRAKKEKLI